MNNRDSLRTQIIEAMIAHQDKNYDDNHISCYEMFDDAIMPVLDAAMKAGELLVHRATTPQKPIDERITTWMDGVCQMVAGLHNIEATASKRQLLNILYTLEESAIRALADARAIRPLETTSESLGKLLTGKPSPAKG